MTATERIAALMREQGVSQVRLADLSGVERTALNRFLGGKRPLAAADMYAIADVLGLDPTDLGSIEDPTLPRATTCRGSRPNRGSCPSAVRSRGLLRGLCRATRDRYRRQRRPTGVVP